MVVETPTPVSLTPSDPDPRFDKPDAGLAPRRVVAQEQPIIEKQILPFETPVPGGTHDLEADEPVDPAEELARLQAEGTGSAAEKWVPFQSSWQPSEQTWKPLAETWEQARTPANPAQTPPSTQARPTLRDLPRAMPPSGPVVVTQTTQSPEAPVPESFVKPPATPVAEALTRPQRTPPPSPATATHREHRPRSGRSERSAVVMPLVWFNRAFDAGLILFGPLGDWLKGPGGRGFLALVGFLCLAGAAALAVADRMGWTW
jgi:hypothetical protein